MGRRDRKQLYPGLIGVAVGALLVGLLVPFVEGERPGSAVATGPASGGPLGEQSASGGTDGLSEVDPSGAEPAEATGTASGSSGGSGGSGGSGPTAGASGGGSSDGDDAEPRRASDQGVTADEIRIAALLLDLGSTGRVGVSTTGVDPEQQRAAFEAYLKDLNDRGGINGRKVVARYTTFDPFNRDTYISACTFAAQDVKAFVVLAQPGFANEGIVCVTKQYKIPLIVTGQANARVLYDEAEGRLITLQMAGDRQMRNVVEEWDKRGLIKGRKFGFLMTDNAANNQTLVGVLKPLIEQRGGTVAHIARVDPYPASGSQIPTEVQRMQAAGVNTVTFALTFLESSQFVQQAERQQYRPGYLLTEFTGGTSDFEAQAMPQSFDGALAMTMQRFAEWRAGIPEHPGDARCRELYEKATGERQPRNNGDESNAAYPTLLFPCGFVRVFEAAAKAAGTNPTRETFLRAMPGLGAIEAAFYFGGAFGPGKNDLTDSYRMLQFRFSCRCWHVASPVVRGRF